MIEPDRPQVLINAVTVQVPVRQIHISGKPTPRHVAYFWVARDGILFRLSWGSGRVLSTFSSKIRQLMQ